MKLNASFYFINTNEEEGFLINFVSIFLLSELDFFKKPNHSKIVSNRILDSVLTRKTPPGIVPRS